jgi:hypothetical protein
MCVIQRGVSRFSRVTGFAKLGHDLGPALLEVLVDACLASRFRGFNPQDLANLINGEHAGSCTSWLCFLGSRA